VTAKVTWQVANLAARLRADFARPFDLEADLADLRTGHRWRGPGRPAGRALDRPRRRPPRADPGPGGPDRTAPGVARPAHPGRPAAARDRRAVHPPGRGDRGGPRRPDVVVVTPTASGKIAVLHAAGPPGLADDRPARALFLFPTKALGQDQVAEFSTLAQLSGLDVAASTYDGDTPGARSGPRSGPPARSS
jgi:hypothetical protein